MLQLKSPSRVGFGALLLAYDDTDGGLAYAGKVGTGFDNRTLHRLHATLAALGQDHSPFSRGPIQGQRAVHWVKPRLVGQVGFTEWTTDGQLAFGGRYWARTSDLPVVSRLLFR